MARYKRNKKRTYNKKARTAQIKKFAYNMGLVERGLKNPDSMISSAYNRGKVEREKKAHKKKTLF